MAGWGWLKQMSESTSSGQKAKERLSQIPKARPFVPPPPARVSEEEEGLPALDPAFLSMAIEGAVSTSETTGRKAETPEETRQKLLASWPRADTTRKELKPTSEEVEVVDARVAEQVSFGQVGRENDALFGDKKPSS